MTVVGCVPLDDRPVSTELPAAVCAVAGATLVLPPLDARPVGRTPGDAEVTAAWLAGLSCSTAVVSLEGLTSGGLIASRTGTEALTTLLGRAEVLRGLRVPVWASVVVPRTPDSDDAAEEPEYWSTHGRALHALSAALHLGHGVPGARAAVPVDVRTDWARRRLRQHQLALAALDLVADGAVTGLAVGVDDAAPASLSVPAAQHLSDQVVTLDLEDRVTVGHGADEGTAIMSARALLELTGAPGPAVAVVCADPGGLLRVPRYESLPVATTAATQLAAAGSVVVPDGTSADVVVVVHAPAGTGDWAVAPPAGTDLRAARATADLVRRHLDAGRPVAVADVAQPNGADPSLVSALAGQGLLPRLAAFAAWNTAGNTLGTVAAHIVAGHVGRIRGTYDDAAHRRLLAARLVEDWAWMSVVRREVRSATGADPTRHDHLPAGHPALEPVPGRLQELLDQVGADLGWRVVASSVRLPWDRTFEVQVDLEPA